MHPRWEWLCSRHNRTFCRQEKLWPLPFPTSPPSWATLYISPTANAYLPPVGQVGLLPHRGYVASSWGHEWLTQQEVLPASSGWGPGVSLSILQCTGRSETENDPVHTAGADDPGTGLSRGQPLLSPLLTGEDTEIQRQTWTHVALGPSTRSGAALPTPAPAGRPPLCLGIQSGAWALSLALGGTASPPGPGEASREDEVARAFGEISWARRSLGSCRAKARPRGLGARDYGHTSCLPRQAGPGPGQWGLILKGPELVC